MNAKNPNEYAGLVEEQAPQEAAFAKIAAQVAEINALEEELEADAQALAAKQERLRKMIQFDLPTQMDAMGLLEFKTKEGFKITIDEKIEAGLSEERRPAGFKWLEENGHGGLIKRQVGVSFNKDQEEAAHALVLELQAKYNVSLVKAVHPSTLKAFVREQLKEGKPLPLETFGVIKLRHAKIEAPKGPR